MHPVLADLLHLLELERIEKNIFRGESRDIGSAQVFGGQVLGQALSAAQHTVEARVAHSLHAYFLRRGDMDAPILYEVDRSRDGGSFSSRRVVAIQHGRPIFNLAASFQEPEDGLEHQAEMPDVAGPEELTDRRDIVLENIDLIPQKMRRYLTGERPFAVRPVDPLDLARAEKRPAIRHVWVRAVDKLGDSLSVHQNLLAYLSDHELLGTATFPHGLLFGRDRVMMASLDHALWFHREFRVDDWLLYSIDSPNAGGARGLARGQIFTQDGVLVASTAQEGLIRLLDEKSASRKRSAPRDQT